MNDYVQLKELKMGLGEAMTRIDKLGSKKDRGIATPEEREEYSLLMSALNHIQIEIGFDCDNDGVPDTIDIFNQTASTSCCRLLPSSQTKSRRKKTTSRRKSK
jgi:hypothetical protein